MTVHRWSDRKFVDVNEAFTRLTGWRAEELIGRRTPEAGLVDPERGARLVSEMAERGHVTNAETPVRVRDGTVRDVVLSAQFVDVHGDRYVITSLVDVSDRRRAEERLEAVWRSSLDAILTMDDVGNIVDANPAAAEMFGPVHNLVGRSLAECLIPPSLRPLHQAGLARYLATRRSSMLGRRLEMSAMRLDGTEFPVELTVVDVSDNARTFFVGTIRDITERRLAEARIEHLNRVYAMLSGINETIVRENDQQAVLDAACRIAVERGGFRMAWVGLRPADSVLPLRIAAHAGADATTLDVLRALLGTETRRPECDFTMYALDTGSHGICNDIANDPAALAWRGPALERGYRSMASLPIRAGGAVIGTFNLYAGESFFFNAAERRLLDELAADISFALDVHAREAERRRVEAALRESEERFRELADTIHEVFWLTDPDKGRVLYVSPGYERIWGRSCEDLYNNPAAWYHAVQADDRERVKMAAMTTQVTGGYDETYRVVRPDGGVRWVHDRAFPVRDASGTVVRIAGVAEDITLRKQLEAQFLQSQKMEAIGQLAGGVAHDFNNLLLVIQGYASLLTAADDLPADLKDSAQEIVNASERAASLTKQLLAFSRRQMLQTAAVELNAVVTNVTRMLERIVGEQVRLRLSLHEKPLDLQADAALLDQVLMNLVVNARDAMPDGGDVMIATSERTVTGGDAARMGVGTGRYAVVRVTDSGTGIRPEDLPHLFEPFFTTKEVGRGTGLGLATVFGIVAQHGGTVQVQSEVGKGTTFEILLPIAGAPNEAGVEPDGTNGPRGHETILVVEDEPSVRRLTRVVLERAGYTVLEAENGVEALRLWREHGDSIDLLLTDLSMPEGITGRELAARLRRERTDLRVVYMSGYTTDFGPGRPPLGEGQVFLQKPSSPFHLLRTVRQCLDGH